MGLKEWLVPQEKKFFDFFEQLSEKVLESAELLYKFKDEFDKPKKYMNKIHKVENEADDIVHTIYKELDKTFITPFDREDISGLASRLDDVLDYMDATVKRIYIYDLHAKPCYFDKFVDLIYHGCKDINNAVKGLRDMRDPKAVEHACIHVNKLENDGDDLLTECLKELFKSDDAKHIMKEKEIYDFLENATDRLEETAFLIMDILLKNT